eukprot:CAMPEP_0183781090 /NCGR_PEP_ID=MMETSP0739-20130205/57894_1 /TAXON_ID=385413 /ORGANISM="Thalassiosira miniscula, Strain CCMP1093" /LENGTH=39 /DNA_ID= /DNA_START= /DNA_END= /DNA_ORIENTATION=
MAGLDLLGRMPPLERMEASLSSSSSSNHCKSISNSWEMV